MYAFRYLRSLSPSFGRKQNPRGGGGDDDDEDDTIDHAIKAEDAFEDGEDGRRRRTVSKRRTKSRKNPSQHLSIDTRESTGSSSLGGGGSLPPLGAGKNRAVSIYSNVFEDGEESGNRNVSGAGGRITNYYNKLIRPAPALVNREKALDYLTAADSFILHSGYFEKQGLSVVNKWSTRYFVLSNKGLFWFLTETDYLLKRQPQGVVLFQNIIIPPVTVQTGIGASEVELKSLPACYRTILRKSPVRDLPTSMFNITRRKHVSALDAELSDNKTRTFLFSFKDRTEKEFWNGKLTDAYNKFLEPPPEEEDIKKSPKKQSTFQILRSPMKKSAILKSIGSGRNLLSPSPILTASPNHRINQVPQISLIDIYEQLENDFTALRRVLIRQKFLWGWRAAVVERKLERLGITKDQLESLKLDDSIQNDHNNQVDLSKEANNITPETVLIDSDLQVKEEEQQLRLNETSTESSPRLEEKPTTPVEDVPKTSNNDSLYSLEVVQDTDVV